MPAIGPAAERIMGSLAKIVRSRDDGAQLLRQVKVFGCVDHLSLLYRQSPPGSHAIPFDNCVTTTGVVVRQPIDSLP